MKQQGFTNRFHTKYSQAVENLGNKEFDKASHDWVVRNLPRLKEDMNEHRVSGFSYINSTITYLHDCPDVLPPNLYTVCVYLQKYSGSLDLSIKKMLFRVLCQQFSF